MTKVMEEAILEDRLMEAYGIELESESDEDFSENEQSQSQGKDSFDSDFEASSSGARPGKSARAVTPVRKRAGRQIISKTQKRGKCKK